jgi:hypothetical protein
MYRESCQSLVSDIRDVGMSNLDDLGGDLDHRYSAVARRPGFNVVRTRKT